MSAAPKFTPGPWALGFHDAVPADGVERKGVAFVNAGETCVAKTDGLSYLSNAHFIAAAPDLYAALEALVAVIEEINGYPDGDPMFDNAKAALAKARGES